jgi:hypothetical protein
MRFKRTHKTRSEGDDWAPLFLEALAECPNAKAAAKAAGIGRATAYQRRESDPQFAKAWVEAIKAGFETLHGVAWRIAVEGVKDPVFHKGRIVGHVTRFNTALMIFLMKVHGPPEFRLEESADAPTLNPMEPLYVSLPEIITRARPRRNVGRDGADVPTVNGS